MKSPNYARYLRVARKREEARAFRQRMMVETFRLLGRKLQARSLPGMYDFAAASA